ncbi:heparan-alpha-glucosaminide N-acetyltransferase domain-containing protein [Micrococcus sp. TA1]|uniref:heparan-alpha-glucosaminide N-acetyltransferase domain-containing protein n=1 Tax=Micrococcus sp. TA1 TaxID=681627 RepID=UPI0016215C03|nr:heparan-alpha-glucosaminide N-acetyltransferase domain-containing protein [Micrococcus sp. TA1]MBB5749036.1 putative membrane protein YeiB [Micrococcus sp. TA1]
MPQTAHSHATAVDAKPSKRVVGIDAARGLALIGLLAAHVFPVANEDTGQATLAHELFAGDSAALFVMLAGVGLALLTGGRSPHEGRRMAADRAGVAVRAVLVGLTGLLIAMLMPADPPANGILLYFAVYFLLAIPCFRLRPRTLFLVAAACGIITPVLMQRLYPVLPETSVYEHTVVTLFTEPVGVVAELLLTGTYPALAYMAFVLVGLGLGRLQLNSTRVQVWIAGVGAGLFILANTVSHVLLQNAGGYQALLDTPGASKDMVDAALMVAPEVLPDTSWWWLAIATPHSNTPFAIASSLGMAMLVLGVVLLVARRFGRWLYPLTAMGAMTMSVYTAHMIALSFELHYDNPVLWYVVHLSVAVVFALAWTRWFGRGPLEKLMTVGAQRAMQRYVLDNGTYEAAPPSPSPSDDRQNAHAGVGPGARSTGKTPQTHTPPDAKVDQSAARPAAAGPDEGTAPPRLTPTTARLDAPREKP